jgi:hypothetical protein
MTEIDNLAQPQTCKACGRPDKFDFHVREDVWRAVVPEHLRSRVVCLFCFDGFAKEKGADYADAIHTLYFAGDAEVLIFERTNGGNRYRGPWLGIGCKARRIGARKDKVEDNPDPKHVSTSYVERHNLTMRMHMRRFTRLTNAFSKKVENHAYAVALHMMYYNFVRVHSKLRMSPAMAAGVSDRLWEIGDIVKLVEEAEPAPKKRGPYKKTT